MSTGLVEPAAGTSTQSHRAASVPAVVLRRQAFPLALGTVLALGGLIQWLFDRRVAASGVLSPETRYTVAQARLLERGYWFANPFWFEVQRVVTHPATKPQLVPVASALHPPLATLVLAMADEASLGSRGGQLVVLALLFLAGAAVVGLAVRQLAGDRAGVLAALLVVLYPELWVNPAAGPVETVSVVVVALLLWGAVRFWQAPTVRGATELGFYCGLCVLTRVDLVLLAGLIVLGLLLWAPGLSWAGRGRCLAALVALSVVVGGPWVGRNLQTFSPTVVVSDGPGYVVGRANCPATYGGTLLGWATASCPPSTPGAHRPATSDEAVVADQRRSAGTTYAGNHAGRLVPVLAARLGRLWNLYRPGQTVQLEVGMGRPAWVSDWGLVGFWVLVPLALAGSVVLRRRRALLFPFLATAVVASLSALAAYGDARLRLPVDVALAALAAVALDAGWSARRSAWSRRSPRGRHVAP